MLPKRQVRLSIILAVVASFSALFYVLAKRASADTPQRLRATPAFHNIFAYRGTNPSSPTVNVSGDSESPLTWVAQVVDVDCQNRGMEISVSLSGNQGRTIGEYKIISLSINTSSSIADACQKKLKITPSAGVGYESVPPVYVELNFRIYESGSLTVTPASLTLATSVGENPAPAAIRISKEQDSLNVHWNVETDSPWLELVLPSSRRTAAPSDLVVKIKAREAALGVGVHRAVVQIVLEGWGNILKEVPVTLSVSSGPRLRSNMSELNFFSLFGANPVRQIPISISGDTQSPLNWRVDFDDIDCSSKGMSINPSSNPSSGSTSTLTQARVAAETSSSPGNWCQKKMEIVPTGGVGFESVSPFVITLSFQVFESGRLVIQPDSLSFNAISGSNPVPKLIRVTKAQNSVGIPWDIESQAAWLSATPLGQGRKVSSTPMELEVLVKPVESNLQPGVYRSSFQFIVPTWGNIMKELMVTLVITGSPRLSVNPMSLDFSSEKDHSPPPKTFTVSGDTSHPLLWRVSQTGSDCQSRGMSLSVNYAPTTGLTNQGRTVTVTPNTTQSSVGSCYIHLKIEAIQGIGWEDTLPKMVNLNFRVTESHSILADPNSLSFTTQQGVNPAAKTVAVSKSASAPAVNWEARVPQNSWISVSPPTGNSSTPQVVTFSVRSAEKDLAPGEYSETVTFSKVGGSSVSASVVVSLTVLRRGQTPVSFDLKGGWNEISWESSYGAFRPATLPLGCIASGKYEGLFGGFLKDWFLSLIWPAHAGELYVRCKAAPTWTF